MTAPGAADTAAGLARWLGELWNEPVQVANLSESSAGARRRNVLFDANVGGRVVPLAATILPTLEIMIVDVGTEAGVRTLAEEHGVPTPHIHGVCHDHSYVGGPFFISDRIEGETIPRRVLRLAAATANGGRVVEQIGAGLAHLHHIDPALAPPLLPRLAGDRPIAWALAALEEAVANLLQPEPVFDYGLRWLRERRPSEPERITIIHTDVRNGNIIVGPDGLQAILDWEGSRLGDPAEDTAWTCTRMWRFGEDHLTIGGLGTVEQLRAGYEGAGGTWDDPRFRWWRVLLTLRWGTGLAGQTAQHLDGRFRSIVMAGSGRRVPELCYDALLLMKP